MAAVPIESVDMAAAERVIGGCRRSGEQQAERQGEPSRDDWCHRATTHPWVPRLVGATQVPRRGCRSKSC